ncbi:MAG TPA: DUF6491 family protein [Micropepsaceae bacterium]|jgi:hypothetical protein|nr:DUF6491 family protein [Micropepsaceae bacterium]
MARARPVLVGLLAVVLGLLPAHAQPGDASHKQDCFFRDDFQNWRSPDPATVYIRVRPDHYYRLDLAGQCRRLQSPGAHLINSSRGKSTICSPLDWDLRVTEQTGEAPEQCAVRSMTRLNPAEVDAIPKGFKP